MEYDIAEILEVRETAQLLKIMQEEFEERVGRERFFRITGTPVELALRANLEDPELTRLLSEPPNPNGRSHGWTVKPLPPLQRTALGFQNERTDFHHMKFLKNGHLEFWTAIDEYFCWRQDGSAMKTNPRFYPYAVVEYPVSFLRLYQALAAFLGIRSDIIVQMQYLNVRGAILLPYQPESIGFMVPMQPVKPLTRDRLVFEPKRFPVGFDPDRSALQIIQDLYYEFGYGREHIPFFDPNGHSVL